MAQVIYLMCALTSMACAWLLGRAYLERRGRLSLWMCICFVGLALNNFIVFVDLILVPEIDLYLLRASVAFVGLLTLVFGLIWDS